MAPLSPTRKDSVSSLFSDSTASSTTASLAPGSQDDLAANASRGQAIRASSVDSNITSAPSTSPLKEPSATDVARLLTAAGSPEEAILRLLREKHALATQNASLWKYVEKQRPMLIGLNRDLENAIRDKERYRNRLKELHASWKQKDSRIMEETIRNSLEEHDKEEASPDLTNSNIHRKNFSVPEATSAQQKSSSDASQRRPGELPLRSTYEGSSSPNFSSAKENRASIAVQPRRQPPTPSELGSQHQISSIAEDSASDYEDAPTETIETEKQAQNGDARGRPSARQEEAVDSEPTPPNEKQTKRADSRPNKNRKKQASKSLSISLPERLHRSVTHPGLITPAQTPLTSFWKRHKEDQTQTNSNYNGNATLNLNASLNTNHMKSPGLPISPRPNDRPPNLPPLTPRAPKDSFPGSLGGDLKRSATDKGKLGPDASFTSERRPSGDKGKIDFDRETARRAATLPVQVTGPPVAEPQSRIYRGLVSGDFPDLLLPPTSLYRVEIRVASSRMRPKRNSYLFGASKQTEDDSVFTLSVYYRNELDDKKDANEGSNPMLQKELWRVEKTNASLLPLDDTLRTLVDLPVRPPERNVFSGHSPAKVDARRAALNAYFGSTLDAITGPKGNVAARMEMCHFLSSDVIEPRDDETALIDLNRRKMSLTTTTTTTINESPTVGPDGKPRMEGYLTKRGKNFGGWKARYFVLRSPRLMYYESPGGAHLGTIKIEHAQIGKQAESDNQTSAQYGGGAPGANNGHDDSENQYRHAFLILEPKKKDSNALMRHVLCAESDEERDAWVKALLSWVEDKDDDETGSHSSARTSSKDIRPVSSSGPGTAKRKGKSGSNDSAESPAEAGNMRSFSCDSVASSDPSQTNGGNAKRLEEQQRQLQSHLNISGPTNGSIIQDAASWGNIKPNRNTSTSVKEKKRSIWGFNRGGNNNNVLEQLRETGEAGGTSNNAAKKPAVPAFGLPLADAIRLCPPKDFSEGADPGLPAVVYRCIAYLRAHEAAMEEGIFRLSGSNILVRQLKERFNLEGDVDLLSEEEPYMDVHAVASLFKQYLRELPESVLTRDLHLEFIKVLDLPDKPSKLSAFNTLVHLLPPPNLTLLSALSELLIYIVSNCDVNRMTVRNMGIVFAPTLNIPAPVFSMFLTDYDAIFGAPPLDDDDSSASPTDTSKSPFSEGPPHLKLEIPQGTGSSQQAPSDRLRTPGPMSPHSASPVESLATPIASSSPAREAATGRTFQGLSPSSPLRPPPRGTSRVDYRATIGGVNNLLVPPGVDNDSNEANNGPSKQKRRESTMMFMNMGGQANTGAGGDGGHI